MTREELAKKKGLKTKTTPKTASESLITTRMFHEPEKKEEVVIQEDVKPEEALNEPPFDIKKEEPVVKNIPTIERKTNTVASAPRVNKPAGRPKGPDSTKISLNIPNDSLELVGIAAGLNHKGNISGYINALIQKDIKENGDIYARIKAMKIEL